MKIAICNVQEFDPKIGGVERVSVSLAEKFIEKGIQVLFLSCRRSPYRSDYELPATQYIMPDPEDYSPRNCDAMAEILNKERVDILLNQNAHSLAYCQLCAEMRQRCGVKTISVLHFCPDMRIKANRNLFDRQFFTCAENLENLGRSVCTYWPLRLITMSEPRKLYRYIYNTSDRVVLLSDKFFDTYLRIANLSEHSKLRAINNILSFPWEESIGSKKKRILFCGRLAAEKAPYRALYAWLKLQDALPDWDLCIVGDGPLRDKMQRLHDRLGLKRVEFCGLQESQPFYRDASILWMTSNFEGWSLALTEAMQYGCVPIAFNSYDSITDIIDNGRNGCLIRPFDIRSFAERTLSLIRSGSLPDYAVTARHSVKHFAPDIIINQWMRIFDEIL